MDHATPRCSSSTAPPRHKINPTGYYTPAGEFLLIWIQYFRLGDVMGCGPAVFVRASVPLCQQSGPPHQQAAAAAVRAGMASAA